MLEPTPGDPHSLAAKSTGGGGHGSISFEDFTATTLRAVRSALDSRPGGHGTFYDPEILIGIVMRPPRDVDLGSVGANQAKPG